MNSMSKQIDGSKPCTSASALVSSKNKNLSQISRHKDSPRSGSDADVFVDVESIDERGYSLINQHNLKSYEENYDNNYDNETMETGNEYYEEEY